MSPSIAVAHYPEGAGHATRMLAVAEALADAGGSVRMAGGGAGTEFVALNGYDEFEPATVDFVEAYQGGSAWRAARRSLPASLARIADYRAWLAATEPDALVTDDMFAAMAATRCGVPLYVLKHDVPALYDDALERTGARFHTLFQLSAAREFFYPVVWPASGADPERATRIPPVALEGDAGGAGADGDPAEPVADAPEVVVVPSHYSSLSRIADHLRRQGYDVLDVADDDWAAVPSLLPYLRAAEVVVCSGYSTVMDAAVAGTPCVVHPATDEQAAVADWLERFDVAGFTVADRPIDVLDAVADPPAAPAFDNGAEFVAEVVLADLRDPDPYADPVEPDDWTDDVPDRGRTGPVRAVAALAAAGITAATAAMAPARIGRSLRTRLGSVGVAGRRTAARLGTGLRNTCERAADGGRRVLGRLGAAAASGAAAVRRAGAALAARCRGLAPSPSLRR